MSSRSKIHLTNNAEDIYSVWHERINFRKLIPSPRVNSIFEVCSRIKFGSLSAHYDYFAVVNTDEEKANETLYLISLKENRVELLKSFTNPVNVIYFVPDYEDALLLSSDLQIFYFNLKNKIFTTLEGHRNPPTSISCRRGSDILVSWNVSEILLFSWPQQLLMKRLNLETDNFVIEAGHIWENQIIYSAFSSGVVLLWDQRQNMQKYMIEPPSGILMKFRSFSLSCDGEWLIGVGSQAIIAIYSMISRRVTQVIHLSHINSSAGIYFVKFLPCIHPQYLKTFLVQTSKSIVVADFVNSSVVKVLNSRRYSISNICISGDGFVLSLTYGNGVSKLYTLLSFFPPPSSKLDMNLSKEVKFDVMRVNEKEEDKSKDIASLFEETKWKQILEEFEEFPKNYRKHIWVSLMKLPRNYSVLNDILIKKKKIKFDGLERDFDASATDVRALRNVLECLCCWSPFLSRVEFLPNLVFPFLKVFDSNIMLCFETSVFIIQNWYRIWIEKQPLNSWTFPSLVEDLLHENDDDLLKHLDRLKISINDIVSLLLSSAFRQVLHFDEWMILWDHIICKSPSFIICVCASFIICLRQSILKCSERRHAMQLFLQETWIPVRSVIKKAKKLLTSLNLSREIAEILEHKVFLPKGALIPYDYSSWDIAELNMEQLNFDVVNNEVKKTKSRSGVDINPAGDDPIAGSKYTEMDHQQLRLKENDCLRSIQRTRKKLIEKTHL